MFGEGVDMITIQLNEHSAEDSKAIKELRELGFTDDEIQKLYDNEQKKRE